VFHLPVPNIDNAVNVNIQTCVAEDPEVIKQSVVPWISQGEENALLNGLLIEYKYVHRPAEGETPAEAAAILDAKFGTLSTAAATKLEKRYRFWHYDRDVP
jgi:hypothetical protein